MHNKSLKDSGRTAIIWSFLIQGGTLVINFTISIILARLLMPEEFGLIGMIAVFMAISRALLNGGFVSSLIRTKDANDIDYSTVFFVNLLSAIVLYGILFISAPYIANFYDEEILVKLIRVLGLVLIVNAFSIVQSTKLNKELQFKTQFKLQIPSLIISAIISIWMAYNGLGVWSLVAKDLSFAIIGTMLLWWYGKWIPSFIFDKKKFKYHFNFGYKLSLTQIINTGFENFYNIIIGKFFSATQLGYYTRARALERLPSTFFLTAFNRASYPLLAKVNDEKQLKNAYSKILRIIVFTVTPIMVFLGVIAMPFFRFLLTEKWLPAVPYFQLLLISGIFFPIYRFNFTICNLKGRSDFVLKLSILQNFLLLLGSFSAIWFGIYGLLYSLITVNISIALINAFYSGRLIDYGLKNQLADIMPILILNFAIGIIFYLIQITWLHNLPDIWNILLNAILFFALYLSIAFIIKLKAPEDIKSFLKTSKLTNNK